MRKFFVAVSFLLFLLATRAQEYKKVTVIKGIRTAITPKLSKWKPDFTDPILKIKTRDEKGLIFARDLEPLKFINFGSRYSGPDPVLQKGYPGINISNQSAPARSPTLTDLQLDGATVDKNFDGIGFSNVSPADPTMAIGPNHIIQMVNGQNGSAYFRIYDKNGGSLSFQAFMDQLPGSSYNGAGDCITWYDQLSDRYVMTEFGDSSKTGTAVNSLIFAVSQTNDPLGSWYIYEFSDASFFPDYPKYGNWSDAWYGMTRDFVGAYVGNSVWAFDKAKMIAGDPTASVQRIRLTDVDNKYNSMCPVSLIGSTLPPPGSPGLFLYYNDDNFTSSPSDTDSLGIVGFSVDFTNPNNSQASIIQSLPVAPFRSNVCNTRNCAPTAKGIGYDVISSRIMNRPYYRNFGSYEAIVANHTVDATGTAVSGLRWYELRKTSSNWDTFQQGTFAPQAIIPCVNPALMHRFMGAITLNSSGQLAMAYNNTSASSYGSISFTGRNANDPLNIMSYEEFTSNNGTGYGTFGNRWGDYNEIVPDISNDSIFWFTAMYGSPVSWNTRIISFKLSPNKNLDARLVSIDYPNTCENSCSNTIVPKVTIRNTGNTALNSLDINYQVNGGPVLVYSWTGNLLISQQTLVTLPLTIFPYGNSVFKVYLSGVNGNIADEIPANDSLTTMANIGTGANLPLSEDFENTLFPPLGWTRSTNSNPVFNWERTTAAAHKGTASIIIDNFNQNQPGKSSDIKTPVLNTIGIDSLSLSFWMAASIFDNDNIDTLEVLVSGDCGNSYQSVWKKWGQELITRPGVVSTPFVPDSNEWRQVMINLNDFVVDGKIIVCFRNINGFGNNIYIDDINFISALLPSSDVSVFAINNPRSFICNNLLEPNISFVNFGKDTLRTVNLQYILDGGNVKTLNWTGLLARMEGAAVNLPDQLLTPGNHSMISFGTDPNGMADQNPKNDTSILNFQVKQVVNAPVIEGFEGQIFPPDQWSIKNPDQSIGWERNTKYSFTGIASTYINNYKYETSGKTDDLISPMVKYSNVDSVFISFMLAAATRDYPGSTDIPLDTLEVLVSDDCGINFTSVYKKWGIELQTIISPNKPYPPEFSPNSKSDWRKESINVSGVLGNSNSFVVAFRNISNAQNNIYIDDVNIYTKTLAPKLKENGYIIIPNPFRNRFVIQNFPDASTLKSVEVYTTAGQLAFKKTWTPGTADSYIEINLDKFPTGIYFVKMIYTDKVVTEKIMKGY